MAFLITQAGSSLYKVDLGTGAATALTLPTGVTLSTTRKPRFAVLNQWIIMVNSPTRNLAIDPEGTVRVLVPAAPDHAPYVGAGAGTGLTGAYLVRPSYVVLDSDGNLLMESPLGPASVSFTAANQDLSLTKMPISIDTISALRIYRTLTGGSTYYHLLDRDGNSSDGLINNTPDATLSLLPAQPSTLTSPPGTLPGIRFKQVVEWKSRLWGIADEPSLIDNIYASETNKIYAWPNTLVAYPTGQDEQGCIGFAPRRNQLGVLKRSGLWMISGTSNSTGTTIAQLSISQIAYAQAGSISPDTIVAIGDSVYWLGNDGVYRWDDNGVKNVSDDEVGPWFTSDTYFNRTRFANAFAKYNADTNCYDLHLAALGSSTEDRWISLNITTGKWFGPHKTALFTPSHAISARDGSGLPVTLVGGTDGIVYTANNSAFRDGAATAIDFDAIGPWHHGDNPDVEHFWGQLSVLSKVESGGTLTVTPTVGRINSSAGAAISVDLTLGRQLLRRLGDGALVRLRMSQATVNQGVSIYGYEIPNFENGRR